MIPNRGTDKPQRKTGHAMVAHVGAFKWCGEAADIRVGDVVKVELVAGAVEDMPFGDECGKEGTLRESVNASRDVRLISLQRAVALAQAQSDGKPTTPRGFREWLRFRSLFVFTDDGYEPRERVLFVTLRLPKWLRV